jgi:Fe-S-cluster-containing dehydrogenase component
MHCEQPTCAEVCPADAIKRSEDGIVQSARKPRCIACGNCVVACPFGVPELYEDRKIMMKCDMCYDRTSIGKKPMCATVCPSGALYFGTRESVERLRREKPVNEFQFGKQTVRTKVNMMAPLDAAAVAVDVADFLPWESDTTDAAARARSGAPDAAARSVWDTLPSDAANFGSPSS